MRFSEDPNYAFVVGRIRAREVLLLKRSDYDRLVTLTPEKLLVELKNYIGAQGIAEAELDFEKLVRYAEVENEEFFQKYCHEVELYNLITDRAILKKPLILKKLLNVLRNEFLNSYFELTLDLENLRTLIRIKYLTEKLQDNAFLKDALNNYWLPGGRIGREEGVEILTEPWSKFIENFAKTKYSGVITEGIEYLLRHDSFLRLERKIAEEKQKILLLSRYAIFGYEPLVAYYLFKRDEIRNLKIIIAGVKEDVPRQQLKEGIVCIL
jgi:vacuolar-type H+-ATPase subunit C/Vma6